MTDLCTISNVHIKKLDHAIDEIRLRSLENVISKLDLGYKCDCNAVKKELLVKLFKWFSIEPLIEIEKVLDLLIRILKSDGGSYLNCFGRIRFQNELRDLRTSLDRKWHDKVNQIEEIGSNPPWLIQDSTASPIEPRGTTENNHDYHYEDDPDGSNSSAVLSPLNSSVPFDLTVNCEDAAVVSRKSGSSVKWLVMPWQVLASSDKGIFLKIEHSLSNSLEIREKIDSCHFITNIMLQDFPAEVFLQRPNTVKILLDHLHSEQDESNADWQKLVITILRTLLKLTRSLKLRLHHYCDPGIAHKAQKILARNLENEECISSQRRDSPEGEPPEHNYQSHQAQRLPSRSPSLIDEADDAMMQIHQMLIPDYCTETLTIILKLLSVPNDSSRPLKIVRFIADLAYELVQLLITSVRPTVWFCNDDIALKIHESIKSVFGLFSEILEYFGQFDTVDYQRTTYLYFLWILVRFLSNIMPLELADQIIPKKMKVAICVALIDAPIYLMYPSLHLTLHEYAKKFHGTQECEYTKLFDESRLVIKSMKASISLMKGVEGKTYSDDLKKVYASKLSLLYHKNLKMMKKFINLAQNRLGYPVSSDDREITTKMMLSLLAHNDVEIQEATYNECRTLVNSILGMNHNRIYSWKNLIFLMESSILTEIICHGATSEDEKIKSTAEVILCYFLNGQTQLTESGWSKFLDALVPVFPLLQCFACPSTLLGESITKMLNPDVFSSIKVPFIEVLKGNIRLLFSPMTDVRDEAICRLLWLLAQEKNADQKLPRLSSLHGLPLGSLCVFDRDTGAKRPDGNYQRSSLVSVLEILQSSYTDPKMRRSALAQVSVLLTDTSLHKLFMSENGLSLILDIFSKALIEKDCSSYPDSVVPILTILKLLASSDGTARIELSNQIDVYYNILRSLFLYPNNECVKADAAQLLTLLLYHDYIMRLTERSANNPLNISLPYLIINKMQLPFTCKAHWKTSVHKRTDVSILHRSNPVALTFVRTYWAWEWNDGEKVLWKKWQDINDPMITENLMIRENELACLTFSSIHYCLQQQLYNIQNSITHNGVSNGVDFLTMYMKLSNLLNYEHFENVLQLPWASTFERFLQSHPTSRDDYELFNNVLNFLHLYMKITEGEGAMWLYRSVMNMMNSLPTWLRSTSKDCDDVHQSVLRLARACAMTETEDNDEINSPWISFVNFTVSNLVHGEYYNLAFLDWMLSTLTHVIGKCVWKNHKETLMSIGSALIELILSFHREGTYSFMGLTITRDCIICLNHVLHQMQVHLNKNMWVKFWYGEGQSLHWLAALWRSRDPLVRASALQLLASLINGPHTALQLLNAIDASPAELCHSLLYFVAAQEESCIVKEEACLAMAHLVVNSNSVVFQYVDALKPSAMLAYMKENDIYHEIAVMCSNCYMLATLDPDTSENLEPEGSQTQSLASSRSNVTISMVPKTIYYLYDCREDYQKCSAKNSDILSDEDYMQFIATPSLITSLCLLLNNLIAIGEHEVIREIFEHSLHKHMIDCFSDIPKTINDEKDMDHYSSVLEMYAGLCTVLTNCIIHSHDFACIVTFSPDFITHLFELLNTDLYSTQNNKLIQLRNRLQTEIFKFLVSLSLTDNQHQDAFQTSLKNCDGEILLKSICNIVKTSKTDLGYSALGFLTFLLSLEIQEEPEQNQAMPLKTMLDGKSIDADYCWDNEVQTIRSDRARTELGTGSIENPIDKNGNEEQCLGAEICKTLVNLFVVLIHAGMAKKGKHTNDKDLVTTALTNLLCISERAKKEAIAMKFPASCLLVLKEVYVRLNAIPMQVFKTQVDRGQKMHPLLHEIDLIYALLMNFMYDNIEVKETFAKAGLADVIHKLWAHTSMDKKVLINSLKLLSTFTSNCSGASQSLTLTTVTPGVGLRKTPNSISLMHVIVQMVIKEIDTMTRNVNCEKLNLGFHILENAIHNHDCRFVISKSNLLQFFTKIHPSTTKRTKLSQIVEINCLEFLLDFTFYDEGQIAVSKATDSLEVLINLARLSSGSTRLLAISILRNLAFNATNRPRLLGSTDYLDLLSTLLTSGTSTEIELASSTLWSLVSNNQKGKLIARSAGFPQCLQSAISRLSLSCPGSETDDNDELATHQRELVAMLEYVLKIVSPPR